MVVRRPASSFVLRTVVRKRRSNQGSTSTCISSTPYGLLPSALYEYSYEYQVGARRHAAAHCTQRSQAGRRIADALCDGPGPKYSYRPSDGSSPCLLPPLHSCSPDHETSLRPWADAPIPASLCPRRPRLKARQHEPSPTGIIKKSEHTPPGSLDNLPTSTTSGRPDSGDEDQKEIAMPRVVMAGACEMSPLALAALG